MTVGPSIDPARFLKEELAEASPDLLRELLTTFVERAAVRAGGQCSPVPWFSSSWRWAWLCQRRFRLGRGGCRRVEPTAFGWSMIGVAAFTVLVMVLAALAQLIAWVAAVVDTAKLPDKTWFIVLLVTGLVGVGFVAMIAYVVAGPDRRLPSSATADVAAAGGANFVDTEGARRGGEQ